MMMGTINYMAPEQIRGERIDHRADIFSTGVVLYELLERTPRVRGRLVCRDAVQDPAGGRRSRCSRSTRRLPIELVQIVERALAKPRDERYQHMSEMLLRSRGVPAAARRAWIPRLADVRQRHGAQLPSSAPTVQAARTSSVPDNSAPSRLHRRWRRLRPDRRRRFRQRCSRSRRGTRARRSRPSPCGSRLASRDIRARRGCSRPTVAT